MIITDPTLLRVKCTKVLPGEVSFFLDLLEQELKIANGLGLAAPQINYNRSIAIVRVNGYKINLVNAKIKIGYDKSIFSGEGCLSFPGQYVKTLRYKEIVIEENLVEPHSFIATGLLAVVCQHELYHLEGILLPDLAI